MTASNFTERIVQQVNAVRASQQPDGSIHTPDEKDRTRASTLLQTLAEAGLQLPGMTTALQAATCADLQRWLDNGLEHCPLFDATLQTFKPPEPGQPLCFLAPMRATNGSVPEGLRLEIVVGYRKETRYLQQAAAYTNDYRAPFQCIHLEQASSGFLEGNCIVLFPESVSTAEKVQQQHFVLFFFNKFRRIYTQQTLKEFTRLFGHQGAIFGSGLSSSQLSAEDMYDARCLWGYFHDYAHHTGPRPLDQHLHLKLNWYTGLLEEIKCDLITVVLMDQYSPAFAQDISEFILLERMFRYPLVAPGSITFDAGTGILLFEVLCRTGVLALTDDKVLTFDTPRLIPQIKQLIDAIENLERLDDEAYLAGARSFIWQHLGSALSTRQRFDFPSTHYARLVAGETSL